MSSLKPSYFPSPNWDIPADSDIVILGRIIKDPKDPESKVPESGIVPLPKVFEGEKTDWNTTVDQVRSNKIGLWAKCLQVIQGDISFSQIKSTLEDHKFSVLETSYIRPDEIYLAQAVEDLGVQAYFQVHHWRKPVYLITGIKIAKGASVSAENRVVRSTQAELKVDATSMGVDAKAGPEASHMTDRSRGISYGGSTDYIFAYQLTRIKPKNKGNRYRNQNFVSGALYGKDENAGNVQVKSFDNFDIGEEIDGAFFDSWEQIDDHEV